MTSPDSSPHLSLDALADLLAGEGSEADLAHVGACSGCAGRLDELATADAEVSAVLAALPVPPMPADLTDRLSAALAAEPALEPAPASEGPVALGDGASAVAGGPAGVPAGGPAGVLAGGPAGVLAGGPAGVPAEDGRTGSATVTPFPHARRRRSWLPAAAGIALVVSGGALGASLLLSGGSEDETAGGGASTDTAAAPADELSGLTRNETGTDYAAEGSLATALPGLLAGTTGRAAEAPPSAAEPAQEEELGPVVGGDAGPAPSGPEEDAGDFATQGSVDPALDRLRTPEGLASCLTAVLPPDDPSMRPLAIDYASYQGQPALVVVLPADGAPDEVDVFVVGAGCAVGNDATLFFTRLDRPE